MFKKSAFEDLFLGTWLKNRPRPPAGDQVSMVFVPVARKCSKSLHLKIFLWEPGSKIAQDLPNLFEDFSSVGEKHFFSIVHLFYNSY